MPLETIVPRITTWTAVWLAAAFLAAVLNWFAVEREVRRLEYVVKPATTTLLLLATLALDPAHDAQRWWFVAALVLCLAGDVFLMLPNDQFVAGLASFLLGHVLFIAGFFAAVAEDAISVWATGPLAVAAIAASGAPVLRGASSENPRLRGPVIAYMTVISLMLITSAATGSWWAVAGAATFVVSDSILARNRFVRPFRHGRLATMVTYHAALGLLVVSLA